MLPRPILDAGAGDVELLGIICVTVHLGLTRGGLPEVRETISARGSNWWVPSAESKSTSQSFLS
jgi:hypothetical protein